MVRWVYIGRSLVAKVRGVKEGRRAQQGGANTSSHSTVFELTLCIFVVCFLFENRPLFQGKDYMHQLEEIISILGTPSDESLAFITNSMAKRAIMQVRCQLLVVLFVRTSAFCVVNPLTLLLFPSFLPPKTTAAKTTKETVL